MEEHSCGIHAVELFLRTSMLVELARSGSPIIQNTSMRYIHDLRLQIYKTESLTSTTTRERERSRELTRYKYI